ncbi:hypothetical protein EDD22DRAFT_845582 [Suillus occidentalis]|nr:hypothetical protein EDD22DRAFT_845582 [Suillus occidentalis]
MNLSIALSTANTPLFWLIAAYPLKGVKEHQSHCGCARKGIMKLIVYQIVVVIDPCIGLQWIHTSDHSVRPETSDGVGSVHRRVVDVWISNWMMDRGSRANPTEGWKVGFRVRDMTTKQVDEGQMMDSQDLAGTSKTLPLVAEDTTDGSLNLHTITKGVDVIMDTPHQLIMDFKLAAELDAAEVHTKHPSNPRAVPVASKGVACHSMTSANASSRGGHQSIGTASGSARSSAHLSGILMSPNNNKKLKYHSSLSVSLPVPDDVLTMPDM